MTTLMIKDLAIASDLDRSAMAAVRGGYYKGSAPSWMPGYGGHDGYGGYGATKTTISAEQLIGQSQNVVNNNGNNVAFSHGITSTVNPTQTANNSINF